MTAGLSEKLRKVPNAPIRRAGACSRRECCRCPLRGFCASGGAPISFKKWGKEDQGEPLDPVGVGW